MHALVRTEKYGRKDEGFYERKRGTMSRTKSTLIVRKACQENRLTLNANARMRNPSPSSQIGCVRVRT